MPAVGPGEGRRDRVRPVPQPEVRRAAFQKEARGRAGRIQQERVIAIPLLNETMQDKAYTTHTYKHTTIGFLADVKDMPNQYAYSKTFFDRWYRPENCTIVVAGDVRSRRTGGARQARPTAAGRAGKRVGDDPRRANTNGSAARPTAKWPLPTLPILYLGLSHSSRRPQ